MMATRGRKSENTVDMSPKSIRFSQADIDTKFKDGRHLKDTLEEILKDPERMIREVIRPIEVYWSSKGYYAAATGNRRLFLFKLLSEQGQINTIPVIKTQKSNKSSVESQDIICKQKFTLEEIINTHVAAKSKAPPEKSDESTAESSATPLSQSKKDQSTSKLRSRKALEDLTNDPSDNSAKLRKSVDKAKRHKPQAEEEEKKNSTHDLRKGLRKRKSDTKPDMDFSTLNPSPGTSSASHDQPEDEQSPKRAEEPKGAKETFRSPNKNSEEDEDSPKRRRLTPSPPTPDPSSAAELKPANTGNSQEFADLNLDWSSESNSQQE